MPVNEMRPGRVLIAPSLLSADFGALESGVRAAESMGGDAVHVDVMDGCFVPPITFGAKAVGDLKRASRLPFDVHLMVCRPETHLEAFAAAGADWITVHAEACVHLHRILSSIRGLGKRPGVAIVPSTPVEAVREVLSMASIVLVMTVNPGWGGQEMIGRCLAKVAALRRVREEEGLSFLIEVDGGINRATAREAVAAGADVLVAGSALYGADAPGAEVAALRGPW